MRCCWWVFIRFAMLREMPVRFYETFGSATNLYYGPSGLDFVLFTMFLPEMGLARAPLNAPPPKNLTTSLGLIRGGSPAAALSRLGLGVEPRWEGHRGIWGRSHSASRPRGKRVPINAAEARGHRWFLRTFSFELHS